MKQLSLALILGMSAFMAHAGCVTSTPNCTAAATPVAPKNADSQLQAACVRAIKPTLQRGERIRDIGQSMGKVDKNINFSVSANGGAVRVVSCQVQTDGSLSLVNKGGMVKSPT